MRPELRKKIIEHNKALYRQKEKAADLDKLLEQIRKLSVGQPGIAILGELLWALVKYGNKNQ